MHLAAGKQQRYYFSDKLRRQLGQISQYPLTIVEAPSGFGKTTAIREYLRGELPQAAYEWYTCLGESASLAWTEICGLFARVSSEVADDIKNLKIPSMDTLFYMKAYLKKLECRRKTYLVIDNYHLINFDMHRELINVFSQHENPNLHMIFIMQQLDARQQLAVHNHNIHAIDASAFFFDREGISALFRMEGLRLTEGELEHVFKNTEGWISAIRLQMIHYMEAGSFVGPAGIEKLVETAIWNRLAPLEQDFMLTVSVFDSFTAHQATAMLDYEISPGEIEAELKTSDFIRFLPDKRLFIIHSILLDYLRSRFCYHQPKEYRNRIFHKAGLSCAAMGQYCLAAKFFYKVADFGAILSLPFTRQYLDAQKEACDTELLMAIIRECPEEVLCRHPSTMIVFAHYLLLNGQYGLYGKLCRLLRLLVQREADLPQRELRGLTGEILLLETLGEFNDLSKMLRGYEAADRIFGESPDIIENSIPWLSVFPTAFGIFWREPGKLDEMLDNIAALKPIYRKFSRGQGAGLGHLIRAEAVLARGEDDEAEILCHKALYEARAHRQVSICVFAELCLARVFILRGDAENFFTAMGNLQGYAAEHADLPVHRMVDICMSVLGLLLEIKDYVAPWLYIIDDIRRSLYAPLLPLAEILHFGLLLLDKRYNELYAVSQLALDTLRSPGLKIKYVLPQMCHLIFLGVAKYSSGNDPEARHYIREALDMALPDRIYLPFTDHACMADILAGLGGEAETAEDRERLAALLSLCERNTKGINTVRKAILQNKSPLTPREREIALLAQKRLSAREIAAKLYISEKTVKSTLRNVYGKLEIHSRSELAAREF